MWTSIELEYDTTVMEESYPAGRYWVRYLKNEVMVLSSPGIASIIVSKSHAGSWLRIQNADKEAEEDACDNRSVQAVAKGVIEEIKEISFNKDI